MPYTKLQSYFNNSPELETTLVLRLEEVDLSITSESNRSSESSRSPRKHLLLVLGSRKMSKSSRLSDPYEDTLFMAPAIESLKLSDEPSLFPLFKKGEYESRPKQLVFEDLQVLPLVLSLLAISEKLPIGGHRPNLSLNTFLLLERLQFPPSTLKMEP